MPGQESDGCNYHWATAPTDPGGDLVRLSRKKQYDASLRWRTFSAVPSVLLFTLSVFFRRPPSATT